MPGSSLMIADVVIWSVFGLLYLAFTALHIYTICKSNFGGPSSGLLLATLCSFSQCIIRLVYLGINLSAPGDHTQYRVVYSLSELFGDWVLAFLFLMLVRMWSDQLSRLASPMRMTKSITKAFVGLYSWSMLLIACGAVTSSVSIASAVQSDSLDTTESIVNYVQLGMWFITGLVVSAMAAFVYSRAENSRSLDKIIILATYFGIPLYQLSLLAQIAFSIVLPPGKVSGDGDNQWEFARDVLINVCRFATMIILCIINSYGVKEHEYVGL